MRIYPTSTANRNVPKGVYLIAEAEFTSGEVVETTYVDREGFMWTVCDWVGQKPQPAYMFQLCRMTGDTENMIRANTESYFRFHPVSKGSVK